MRWVETITAVACLAVSTGQGSDQERDVAIEFSSAEIARIQKHILGSVPADPTNKVADNPAAARFGQFLFFERRFSSNGQISCATCHDPKQGFTEAKPLSIGLGELTRHTPALWNVAYNRWFFWDGRADTLWAQALDPLEHASEFGGNRVQIARVIYEDVELRRAYEAIFGPMPALSDRKRFPEAARPMADDPAHAQHLAWLSMTREDQDAVNRVFANVGKAIAAYERRIVSQRSPFDRFAEGLRDGDEGKLSALSPAAQRGLKLFIGEANCRLCHAGPNFSDGEFHNTGAPPRPAMPQDKGRYEGAARLLVNPFNATSPYSDDPTGPAGKQLKFLATSPETWGQFKTPSLRNVAQTAPYMHQGQFTTLRQVLAFYSTREGAVQIGHHQESILQPLNLTEAQLADLEAFLGSLTGEPIAPELLTAPESPGSDPSR